MLAPLKVTFMLDTPMVPSAYPIHLDALVAYALTQTKLAAMDETVQSNESIRQLAEELPFAKETRDGEWVWQASALVPEVVGEQAVRMWTRKTNVYDYASRAASGAFELGARTKNALADGKLYAILSAENIHPGKGTPVTQLDMRRISDGVKVVETYKTTDQLERAFVEEVKHSFLFKDDTNYVFMNPDNYEQIMVPEDMLGDGAPYLGENMEVYLLMFDGKPVSIELPQRVTLEIVETEPVTKGQTASSSYKPAILSNGVRTGVPPHIGVGTRVVIMTEDGSYVERAKD